MNDPMAIAELQRAARDNSVDAYKKFSAANTALSRRVHLRGLLRFKTEGAHPKRAEFSVCSRDVPGRESCPVAAPREICCLWCAIVALE